MITFEYNPQLVFMSQVEVEDIGNLYLRGTNNMGSEYYFLTRTIMGKTHILKFGPTIPDVELLLETFSTEYKKIDYKESTIKNEINKFINDSKKFITTIDILDLEEAINCYPRIIEIYKNLD